MEIIGGKKIAGGIAIGPICCYQKKRGRIRREPVADTEAEVTRYEAAKSEAIRQLHALCGAAAAQVGEQNAQIFEIHAMLLQDGDYNGHILRMIRDEKVNAEYAVAAAGAHFAETFAAMDDEYFRARSIDMEDISERVVRLLLHRSGALPDSKTPAIMMAEQFTPSETVQMNPAHLLAFVTQNGSANSHAAILARTMNLPALTDIVPCPAWNGKLAIVDGEEGKLILEPDAETLTRYRREQERQAEQRKALEGLREQESVTRDGRRIRLCANIGSVSDACEARKNGAEGIGLFRSEFLYLEADDYPDEEAQFAAYRKAAAAMEGRPVVIRTLDIGADKQTDYFGLEQEENPALGCRAIRLCLLRPELLRTQLRAIYRASAYGNVSILYPMITSLEEVREARRLAGEVREQLRREGVPFGSVRQGVMIETPAAALISDLLAGEADFFSIGTNDLSQYTLAIDRQNEKLDRFFDPHHEAVLRLIRLTVQNGHAAGIPVGICGELGADTALTERFLEWGVDTLSVTPGSILPLRRIVRAIGGEGAPQEGR